MSKGNLEDVGMRLYQIAYEGGAWNKKIDNHAKYLVDQGYNAPEFAKSQLFINTQLTYYILNVTSPQQYNDAENHYNNYSEPLKRLKINNAQELIDFYIESFKDFLNNHPDIETIQSDIEEIQMLRIFLSGQNDDIDDEDSDDSYYDSSDVDSDNDSSEEDSDDDSKIKETTLFKRPTFYDTLQEYGFNPLQNTTPPNNDDDDIGAKYSMSDLLRPSHHVDVSGDENEVNLFCLPPIFESFL